MGDFGTYRVRLRGQVDGNELSAIGPVQVAVVKTGESTTLLVVHTDQAGIIGLLRHLHGLGYVLLSIVRKP